MDSSSLLKEETVYMTKQRWRLHSLPPPGSVYAWGMGTNLQLGTGEEDDEWSPKKMTGKQLENRVVLMASSGGQHTVLLVKDKQES